MWCETLTLPLDSNTTVFGGGRARLEFENDQVCISVLPSHCISLPFNSERITCRCSYHRYAKFHFCGRRSWSDHAKPCLRTALAGRWPLSRAARLVAAPCTCVPEQAFFITISSFPAEKGEDLHWIPQAPKQRALGAPLVVLELVLLFPHLPLLFAKVLRNGKAGTSQLPAIPAWQPRTYSEDVPFTPQLFLLRSNLFRIWWGP